MTSVYWSAQYIPSGLISVIYGMSPVVTGLFAAVWLREGAFTPFRVVGMLLGIIGLVVIFGRLPGLGTNAVAGTAGVLLSVIVHSFSAVWVKRLAVRMHPLETTTGALMVALPLFLLCWVLADGHLPQVLPARTVAAILYLAVFGSVLGFVLYFYLLRHSEASRVALVTLVTPVLALLLGQLLNGEVVGSRVWLGTGAILLGLASYQWGDQWRAARLMAH